MNFRLFRRYLSGSQLSTALRPFYFLVHPDLFGKYPEIRSINENSLKNLQSYLQLVNQEKTKTKRGKYLRFYRKPLDANSRVCTPVGIQLDGKWGIRDTLKCILQSVDLPTDYVDALPKDEIKPDLEVVHAHAHVEAKRYGLHPTDINQPLDHWLMKNVEEVRRKLDACEPVRLEIQKIQDALIQDLGLSDIKWDCDLETMHRRGTLYSFQTLTTSHISEIGDILKDKTVVFGRHGGFDLDGRIILYSGDVRYNWLNTVKNVPQQQIELGNIPRMEETLSRSLRNIRVSHRKFQPNTLVEDYRTRLRKLLTNINDYRSRQNYPKSWDTSLEDVVLCMEAEASPLMLSPSGEFIVPASTPGFLLVKFLTEHMGEARAKLKSAKSRHEEEELIILRVVKELGLIQLDKDDSITSHAMIECCGRLITSAQNIRHLMHGNHLVVTRYYSVVSDGSICIPWNFK